MYIGVVSTNRRICHRQPLIQVHEPSSDERRNRSGCQQTPPRIFVRACRGLPIRWYKSIICRREAFPESVRWTHLTTLIHPASPAQIHCSLCSDIFWRVVAIENVTKILNQLFVNTEVAEADRGTVGADLDGRVEEASVVVLDAIAKRATL